MAGLTIVPRLVETGAGGAGRGASACVSTPHGRWAGRIGRASAFVRGSLGPGVKLVVKPLSGKVAVGTGASRGLGKGNRALGLGEAGATVPYFGRGRRPLSGRSARRDRPSPKGASGSVML